MDYKREPVVLSVNEAAEYFDIPAQFIRGRVQNREIPYMMSGKKVYISVKGFINFLEDACDNFIEFDCGMRR